MKMSDLQLLHAASRVDGNRAQAATAGFGALPASPEQVFDGFTNTIDRKSPSARLSIRAVYAFRAYIEAIDNMALPPTHATPAHFRRLAAWRRPLGFHYHFAHSHYFSPRRVRQIGHYRRRYAYAYKKLSSMRIPAHDIDAYTLP